MTLYDILGIPRTGTSGERQPSKISQEEIRIAFRSTSRLHHPDKGGDEEKYKQIVAAYTILNNPETKLEYDRMIASGNTNNFSSFKSTHSEKQNRGPDGPGSFVFTNQDFKETMMELGLQFVKILDTCAQDFFEKQQAQAQMKTQKDKSKIKPTSKTNLKTPKSSTVEKVKNSTDEIKIIAIKVDIADLYNCRTKQLKLSGREICRKCNGVGGKGKEILCVHCKGAVKYCEWCDMRGFIFEEPCSICHGQQLTESPFSELLLHLSPRIELDKLIEIHTRHFILPVHLTLILDSQNVQISHAYTFVSVPNNSVASAESSSVQLAKWFLSASPLSKTNKTNGTNDLTEASDLWCTINIPVKESITKNINYLHKHLDGESYWFVYKDIVPPGQILCADQLGMMRKDGVRGNLFIQFVHHWPLTSAAAAGQQGKEQKQQQIETESETETESRQSPQLQLSKNFYPEINQRAKFGLRFHPNTVVNLQPVNRPQ